jgi:acetyl-CoA carboxylase biotin carboxylase subunit
MRLVQDESRLEADFETAASEALNAFGDASVYLEKYINRPRHVEIQILADKHGNGIHLGERECSVQRRHQKVIEECPSPLLNSELRARMGAAALRVARSVNYENAGTVEFLMDDQRNFYFLEMNTRLQVEHPVTEAVTGLDIVHEQLRIAAGERLSLVQDEVRWRGWAMECRVYAEDPENNFFPSPGTIRDLSEPQGPGVRLDSGVYKGWQVPIHYDPLIAKLVTFGSDRHQAIQRMRRAIREYRIQGVKTNLRFFADVLCDPEFVDGRLSTDFIEGFFARRPRRSEGFPAPECSDAVLAAAVLAYADHQRQRAETPGGMRDHSAWKMAARPGAYSPGRRR